MERAERQVSYSTIYCALKDRCMDPKGSRKNRYGRYPMQKYLRRNGWRGTKKKRKRASFVNQTMEERPKVAEKRSQISNFEGYLVYNCLQQFS